MSHLRPEAKARRHKASWCKRGRHNYDEPQNIGAGILRRVCLTCGAVTLDLTAVETEPTPTGDGETGASRGVGRRRAGFSSFRFASRDG